MRIKLFALFNLFSLLAVTGHADTHIWTGGGSDENWGNPANWTGGQPLIGEAAPVVLIFTNGVTTTNNMSGLVVDSLQFLNGFSTVHGTGIGSLTIRGGNSPTNLLFKSTSNVSLAQTLPFSFSGSNYCFAATGANVNMLCAIGGTGHVTWDGGGGVGYDGLTANTCTGTTRTRSIILELNKPAGVNAIAGPLVMEDSGGGVYPVRLMASNQILDSAPVTIQSGANLYAAGFNETLNDLNLTGGGVNFTTGLLTLGGNIDATGNATINNPISLGGATRTFNVTSGSLILYKVVSNGAAAAGITKTGAGTLVVQGTNTFTGAVTISGGTFHAANDSAFGTSAGGVTLQGGATLELDNMDVGTESLSLAGSVTTIGTNSWAGAVNVTTESTVTINSGEQLTLSGAVTGAGSLSKFSDGTLVFSGAQANTFSGGLAAYGGTVSLNKASAPAIAGPLQIGPGTVTVRLQQANQIADTAPVGMFGGCTLDLNNNAETIGSLAGYGTVNLIFATLTTGGDNTSSTFYGNITGIGFTPIIKTGSGTFTLGGTNTCTGTSQVNAGTLAVSGQLDSHVSVAAGATLTGSGKVGNVIANAGNIRPGNAVGILNTGNLNLTNGAGTVTFEINGAAPGTQHDQIGVTGAVNLNNPSIALSLNTYGAVSNQYVLIANDGADAVNGTFNGLPEGTTLTSGSVSLKITYHGGTGNDVALLQTAAPAPPVITSITKQPNGAMLVNGTGLANTSYYVDATTGLNPPNWVNLTATLANGSGAITFTDNAAPNFSQRFYRLRME